MIRFRSLICVAALLAACAPEAPKAPPPAAVAETAPVPGEVQAETYAACQWGKVEGSGLSIWSYACPDQRLVADAALPGFQRETRDAAGAVTLTPVIRLLAKPADAPIEAVTDAVRALSPGGEACVIEVGANGDHVFMPTGAALAAHTLFVEGKAKGPSMPCGPLGPTEGGGYTLRLIEGAPDKVALINWGTDVPIFDADTLKPAPAAQ